MQAIFETTLDNFVYFAVKGIGAEFQFRLKSRVSGRNSIECANKRELLWTASNNAKQIELWGDGSLKPQI